MKNYKQISKAKKYEPILKSINIVSTNLFFHSRFAHSWLSTGEIKIVNWNVFSYHLLYFAHKISVDYVDIDNNNNNEESNQTDYNINSSNNCTTIVMANTTAQGL